MKLLSKYIVFILLVTAVVGMGCTASKQRKSGGSCSCNQGVVGF
jgi:hypothetical protein